MSLFHRVIVLPFVLALIIIILTTAVAVYVTDITSFNSTATVTHVIVFF